MTPFEAYQTYNNLKLHFTQRSYDYIKYQGKSRLNEGAFDGRPDKIFFQKLAKHKNAFDYILANMVNSPTTYVKELAYSEQCEQVYREWLKKIESITYLVSEDLSKLNRQSFKLTKNNHPPIFKMYLRKEIMLETLCILLSMAQQ